MLQPASESPQLIFTKLTTPGWCPVDLSFFQPGQVNQECTWELWIDPSGLLYCFTVNTGAAIAAALCPNHQGWWPIRTFSSQATESPLLLLFRHSAVSSSLQLYALWPFQAPPAHKISQARILEWVAISLSSRSSQPRIQTCISCIAGGFFYH